MYMQHVITERVMTSLAILYYIAQCMHIHAVYLITSI